MTNNKDFYRRQSKPTEFNNDSFRSRLEAKWAVFFVAAEIDYFYELEGFVLDTGEGYLPDFYLTELETYVEVKPRKKTEFDKVLFDLKMLLKENATTKDYPKKPSTILEQELLKMRLLFDITKKPIILLDNIPTNKPYLIYNGEWSIGYWKENTDRLIYFEHVSTKNFDYTTVKSQLTTNPNENILKCMRIANRAKFEHMATPVAEDIILLRNTPTSKAKQKIKVDSVLELLKKGQYSDARLRVYKLGLKPEYKDFSEIGSFYAYAINSLDMFKLFELKETEPFKKIFDTENTSTFNIIKQKGIQYIEGNLNDTYFKGTIVDVLKTILNKNELQVVNILKYILDVDVSAYNVYWENKHSIKMLAKGIENSPQNSKVRLMFKEKLDNIEPLLSYINSYVSLDVFGNPHMLYHFSIRVLTNDLKLLGINYSETKMNRFVNLCTLTGLIKKLSDVDLSNFPILKQNLLDSKEKKHNNYRADVLVLDNGGKHINRYAIDSEPNIYVNKIALEYFQERGFISFNFLISEIKKAYTFTTLEAETLLMSSEMVEYLFLKHGFIIVTLDTAYREEYFISDTDTSAIIYVQNV